MVPCASLSYATCEPLDPPIDYKANASCPFVQHLDSACAIAQAKNLTFAILIANSKIDYGTNNCNPYLKRHVEIDVTRDAFIPTRLSGTERCNKKGKCKKGKGKPSSDSDSNSDSDQGLSVLVS